MPDLPASSDDLAGMRCRQYPREAGKLPEDAIEALLRLVDGWILGEYGASIYRQRRMKDFASAVALIDSVAELAEAEDHHPDIRLWGYRNLRFDLSTHDSGGLTLNDFIMAAKIDRI